MIYFSSRPHEICTCNINYYMSEPILHPDRVMEEYDFLYIMHGSWDIWENDICYPVREGQLLILEPGKHHYSLEKCSLHMKNIYLHCMYFPEDYLHPAKGECPMGYFRLQKITDCTENPQIERLLLQIVETYWSKTDHRQLRLDALFSLLLAELEFAGENSACKDALIQKITHRFFMNSNRFFSPAELAEEYHISVRSLSDRFKKVTGTSIHQYQLNMKLELAKEQLPLYPNRKLKDVALSLGFYDEFHFSRMFKRKFGFPPSETGLKKDYRAAEILPVR